MNQLAENMKNSLTQTVEILEKHDEDLKNFVANESGAIRNFETDSQAKQENILSSIREYAEGSFSNNHCREREIKVFFEEGIQKDEKQGNTPQRKELNISKRLNILKIKNENEVN